MSGRRRREKKRSPLATPMVIPVGHGRVLGEKQPRSPTNSCFCWGSEERNKKGSRNRCWGASGAPRMAALVVALAGLLLALAAAPAGATTDSSDAAALGNLYTSWSSPSQLAGWSAGGGDPCGAAWQGISCSGSGVTGIKLPGTGLDGTLGYQLSNLFSLKTLDLSNNNLHGSIPYQLPLNLTYLNLATNNFSGNLPYSISNMVSLEYLNLSHNSLSQQMGGLFGSLNSL